MRHATTLAAALFSITLLGPVATSQCRAAGSEDAALIRIDGVTVAYRATGEFLADERPVNGPVEEIRSERPFEIMRRQVTRGEYQRCVAAGACKALEDGGMPELPETELPGTELPVTELPVTGVNWHDAVAYAAWLSDATGRRYRLPTDREWALAAGSRYHVEAGAAVSDPANPAKRWLALYEAEAARQGDDNSRPRPVGSFGANEHGLIDLSGNVWEWTSDCFLRHRTNPATGATTAHENCGVRIAQGRHRAYMTDFIRDPKAGGCSVGIPPANLGIRLVREEAGFLEKARQFLGF